MWRRKNKFEKSLGTLEAQTSEAVGHLAESVRERFDNEVGKQLSENLTQLAHRVDELDLSDTMLKRRKELEKAAKKASRQVDRAIKDLDKTRSKVTREAKVLASQVGDSLEQGGHQLATISQKTVPEQPTGWVLPTLLGFLAGFGAGFLVAKKANNSNE